MIVVEMIMENKKVTIYLLLLCVLFVFLFTGCNREEASVDVTSESEAAVIDGTRTYTELTSDTKIFCTRQWSNELVSLSQKIASAIKEKTGLELEICYTSEESRSEIIVGYFEKSAASDNAYRAITRDQYSVHVEGSTVAISAYSVELLSLAVDEFSNNSIVRDGDKWKLASIAPTGEGKDVSSSIASYRIVYSANADDYIINSVVPSLKSMIESRAKVTLETVSDAEPATEREIVVGNTNRSTETVKRCYEGSTAYESYRAAVIPDGTKLFLVGGNEDSFKVGIANVEKFIDVAELGPKLLDLEAKAYTTSKMTTSAPRELADGADVRIMSYNVLNPVWGSDEFKNINPVEKRIGKFVDLALYYRPDVIGLQEAAQDWHKYLDKQLVSSGIYSFCCNTTSKGDANMTGFLYNPSTVKVVASYIVDLVEGSDHRVISVGVFETLKDGKRFVVMNTHPVPSSYDSYPKQMEQIMELEKQEMEKYPDTPIFFTGDFNTNKSNPKYDEFVGALGVENSRDSADTVLHHNATYAGFKKPKECNGAQCIDHIFHNGMADVKLFNTVVDDGAYLGSDHLPIYADVALLSP